MHIVNFPYETVSQKYMCYHVMVIRIYMIYNLSKTEEHSLPY